MPLPTFSFNDLKKNPFPAFLLILCIAVGYLFKSLSSVSDARIVDCMQEKAALQIQLARKDSVIYELKSEQAVNEALLRLLPHTMDSMVRTPTQEKVTSLLNK